MLFQAIVFDNVSAISMGLATAAVGWSWVSAFRLMLGAGREPISAPACLISGFGQA
jgi:hypothetical protein